RLHQGGLLPRDPRGDAVQQGGARRHVLCSRAVDAVAEAAPRGAQVVAAGATEHTGAADPRGGFAGHALAHGPAIHTGAPRGYLAAELMAERDRPIDTPRLRAMILVQVTAADADRTHAQQHLTRPRLGYRHRAQLDRAVLRPVVHQRRHRAGRYGNHPLSSSVQPTCRTPRALHAPPTLLYLSTRRLSPARCGYQAPHTLTCQATRVT